MEIKIKLFDAKEELPKRRGEYLCFTGGTHWANLPYSAKHKRFNAYNDDKRPKHAIDVLFWAELPELYKEREDESEETEVKKYIEWAIKEIEGLETETSQNWPHNKMIEKDIVLGILKAELNGKRGRNNYEME